TSIPRLPQPQSVQPKTPDPPTYNTNRQTPTIPQLPNNDIRGKLAETNNKQIPKKLLEVQKTVRSSLRLKFI
ncbi:MAG: hypothetical protein ACK53Y_02165, partial [bacterium]